MAGSDVNNEPNVTKAGTNMEKALVQRGCTQDALTTSEARLGKVELTMADSRDQFEAMEECIEKLESTEDELREEMQLTLNSTVDSWEQRTTTLEARNVTLEAQVESLTKALEELRGEFNQCKPAMANGGIVMPMFGMKMEVPKPKRYWGARNARELDIYLWNLERYFGAVECIDDGAKLKIAPLYLQDVATLWRCRRCNDIRRDSSTINTWEEFKTEIKKQFYPKKAKDEARGKLRRLTQKGMIRDYVKEFSELLLEIPDMSEKDSLSLFSFMDGLAGWAKMELQRRDVQTLEQLMAEAESLIEFKKRDPSKPKDKDKKGGKLAKSGGDKEKQSNKEAPPKPPLSKGKLFDKSKSGGDRPRISCYFYDGRHKAMDYPKWANIAVMV